MEATDDDLAVEMSFTSTSDNDYGFLVTIRPTENTVKLSPQDICEPNGKLIPFSRKALYAAVNKKLKDLHVTVDSHILSDTSRIITDNCQLQKALEFDREYSRLFC